MPEPRESDDVTVSACPQCGTEKRVYKCECESPPVNPVWMPRVAAGRLRELHRKAFPPQRLTATPSDVTVWVERGSIRLRPGKTITNHEAATGHQGGWFELTPTKWRELRDCIDKFEKAANERAVTPLPRRADAS